MNEDEKWMNLALKEAKKAQDQGEVPVGAILVKNGTQMSRTCGAHTPTLLSGQQKQAASGLLLARHCQKTN